MRSIWKKDTQLSSQVWRTFSTVPEEKIMRGKVHPSEIAPRRCNFMAPYIDEDTMKPICPPAALAIKKGLGENLPTLHLLTTTEDGF